jgi:pSer/pThr/pTyr-binding forkhead associated (FHA) protein
MSDQEDSEQDSDTGNPDLAGRLRSPTGLSSDSDDDSNDRGAVDRLSERLRGGSSNDASDSRAGSPPSPTSSEDDEASDSSSDSEQRGDAPEAFEDVLLDALDSEEEDSGTPMPSDSFGAPDGGREASTESGDASTHQTNQQGVRQPQTSPASRPSDEESERECPACRAPNPEDTRFCVQCGERLDAEAASDSTEAIPDDLELVCIRDDGSDGKAISIHSETTIIGRDGDQRFPTDEFLNPRHARLVVEEGELHVEDLHSLNGTFIKIRGEVQLKPGDTFLMGRQVLRFEEIEEDFEEDKTSPDGTRYMGSPPPEGAYKVLQLGAGDLIQDVYCLPESGVVLGREKGDIVFPRDKFMSGRHARIVTDDTCYLVDLNSSNGTWIKLWKKTKLEDDDYLFMGQQLFRVERNQSRGSA